MQKYLAILGVILLGGIILALAVYVGYQDDLYIREVAQKAAALHQGASSANANEMNSPENVPGHELYAPSWYGWYGFFRWPNGTTAWAIILTLIAITAQTKETAKAAKATEDSVIAVKETAKRQLRAYVCINSAFLKFPDQALPRAIVIIKNCGQTPAYDVKGWCGCVWDKYPSTKIMNPTDEAINSPVSVLGPDVTVSWGTTPRDRVPQEFWPIMGTPNFILYVTGEITYRDAFGDPHYTRYRLLLGGPNHKPLVITENDGTEAWTLSPDVEGNDAD
jgi:hypothetical protein